jgi:hypothetical protein
MTKHSAILLQLAAAGAAAAAGACKTEPPSSETQRKEEAPTQLAGVWPKSFECSSIAAPAALAPILGGEVKPTESPMIMPKGVAAPCVYDVLREGTVEQWQFDFDCRDNYQSQYDKLAEQYRKQNTEMIADWNQKADAGVFKPNDAGITYTRPGDPIAVEVGQKGLDHHGQALIFLDDDAPCYVRVAGKDAAKRLLLAKLIARNLTFQNAPMTPRAPK